jgi:cleavage stimulation factor subunit 1
MNADGDAVAPPAGVEAQQRKRPRVATLVEPFRRHLYQLMVRQLHDDGYLEAAACVAQSTSVLVPDLHDVDSRAANSASLMSLVERGTMLRALEAEETHAFFAENTVEAHLDEALLYVPPLSLQKHPFELKEKFVTPSLGGAIRCCGFSASGSLVACGGLGDVGVRVFEMETLDQTLAHADILRENASRCINGQEDHTVRTKAVSSIRVAALSEARNLRHHPQGVEALHFSPAAPHLLTGSRDGLVAVADYTLPQAKILSRHQDTFTVRSVQFHPSGECAVVATDHTALRMLLLGGRGGGGSASMSTTAQCVTTATQPHTAALADCAYSPDGAHIGVSSLDGSFTLFDGATGRAVETVRRAHSNVAVTSICFSRSGLTLLTCGMDSVARLWDVRRLHSCVQHLGTPAKSENRLRAVFNAAESQVAVQDKSLFAVNCYDVYSGNVGCSAVVMDHCQRTVASAPLRQVFVTGGDDCHLRLWGLTLKP